MIDNGQARLHAHEQFKLSQARPHLTRCVSGNSLYILAHPELQENSDDLAAINEYEPTDAIHPYITLQSVETNGVQDSFSTENSLQSPEGLRGNANPNVYTSEQFPDTCEDLEYLDFNYSTEFAAPCVQELSTEDMSTGAVKNETVYNDIPVTAAGNNTIGHSGNFNPHNNNNHNHKGWTQEFNVDELNETEFNELTGDLVDMFSDGGLMSSPPELTVNRASYGSSSTQVPNHEYKEISYQVDIQNSDVSQAQLRPNSSVSYGHSARPSGSGMRTNVPSAPAPFYHAYAHQNIPRPNLGPHIPRSEDGNMDFGGLGIFLSPNTSPDDDSAIQVRKNEALLPANHPLHLRLNYPRHFRSDNNADESTGAHHSRVSHVMLRNTRDMLRSDHSQKSQSISKMPLAHMYAMMGLSNDHVKAKWREERIIDIVRAEGFKVGSQTWIRDTEESERFRIINSILFQCGREFGYDKTLIEIIVRRGTYARMQSKLRQERRIKRRVMASQKPVYRTPMHYHQSEL